MAWYTVQAELDGPTINMLRETSAALRRIEATLAAMQEKETDIMTDIDDLNAAVANMQTAVTAAVTDITNLSAELTAALASADNPVAIEAAVTSLNTIAANLNAAVTPVVTPPPGP